MSCVVSDNKSKWISARSQTSLQSQLCRWTLTLTWTCDMLAKKVWSQGCYFSNPSSWLQAVTFGQRQAWIKRNLAYISLRKWIDHCLENAKTSVKFIWAYTYDKQMKLITKDRSGEWDQNVTEAAIQGVDTCQRTISLGHPNKQIRQTKEVYAMCCWEKRSLLYVYARENGCPYKSRRTCWIELIKWPSIFAFKSGLDPCLENSQSRSPTTSKSTARTSCKSEFDPR